MYREICPPSCTSGMCFKSKNATNCCDETCAAGCYDEKGKTICIVSLSNSSFSFFCGSEIVRGEN